MKIALMKDGIVANIAAAADDLTPEQFGELCIALMSTGYDGAQALRSDEACSPGARLAKDGTYLPPEPTRGAVLEEANAKTAAQITAGFRYNGVVLSTSIAAQMRWLGAQANMQSITFPFAVSTADDAGTYQVKDAAELTAICRGMTAQIFAAHQLGVQAKR
jgi:hypothetical protein